MQPQLQKPPQRDKPPCFSMLPLAIVSTVWVVLTRPRQVWAATKQ